MADISAELQAILDATYGEEVRGSIHDAIEKINTVNEEGVSDIESLARIVNQRITTYEHEQVERAHLYHYDENNRGYAAGDVIRFPGTLSDYDYIEVHADGCCSSRLHLENANIYKKINLIRGNATRGFDSMTIQFAQESENVISATIVYNYWTYIKADGTMFKADAGPDVSAAIDIRDIYGIKFIDTTNTFPIGNGTGTNSVIENDLTNSTASGNYSHAEGFVTTASGHCSHAEGYYIKASGNYSHAEGYYTKASGNYSHAEGYDIIASGDYSHAEGEGTKAESEAQHVSGKYNVADSQGAYAEIIGNGSADNARSNARTLDWDGNEWLAGYLELGPNRARLTPEAISHIDGVASTIKSMLTTETVNGNPIILDDAAENMEPVELEVGLLYTKDESTGAITGYTSGSVTVNSDTITTNFPQEAGLVCGGKYDPVNGTLTVTKIGVQAAWGDMIFSIDPDNYLGKRIALTDCFGGLAGAEISDCHVLSGGTNLSPDYIYDQSAATHFYVYNDNIDSYAVVVLPDTTPSDAVITVVGTLKNPITYELTASEILLALEDNTISSNMNAPMKLTYYHDAIRQEQADIQNAKPIFSDPNSDGNIVIYFADEV